MVGTLKLRVEDENEADKFNKVKKFGAAAATTENTRRAALGDLQNRGVVRAATGKEAAQKDLKDSKLQNNIRNAKPRVVTHWKKSTLTSAATTAANDKSLPEQPAATGQPKVLTRSNSVRLVGVGAAAATKATSTGVSLQPRSVLHEGQQSKLKTLTTKIMVENKLQQVKHVNKIVAKPKSIDEKAPITAAAALKREDSNLSRRSLTKLKAALQRDTSSAAGAAAKAKAKVKSAEATVPIHVKGTKLVQTCSTSAVAITVVDVKRNAQQTTLNVKEFKIVSVQSMSRLNAVENIDADDAENLVLVSEYVNDIYDYLYLLETEQEIKPAHLNGQKEVSPKMRAVLVDWINEVHLQFHCIVETYQIAVAIIDRYLQVVKDTQRSHLQLVGVTALFIAAKYEELYPPTLADFVFITDNTYTPKQILQMELQIFKTLDCNLSRPLPIQFLRRFSKAASAEDSHHGMAKYFLELASIEYDMASYKPSEVAAASLFLSLNLLKANARSQVGMQDKHWTSTLEWYSRYTTTHLRPIAKKLATLARNAPQANLKAVYTKYQSSKFNKMSLRPELYGALMDSIIAKSE